MLSKISQTLTKAKYLQVLGLYKKSINFISSNSQTHKSSIQQHIEKAKSIKELLKDFNLFQLAQQQYFRPLMRKTTKLLTERPLEKQEQAYLQKLILQVRRFSSAETHANTTDLLNYQLFFKIIAQHYKQSYLPKGFQFRATLVTQSLPKVALFQQNYPIAMSLLHYVSTNSRLSTDALKRNLQNYFVRYFLSQKLTNATTRAGGDKKDIQINQNKVTLNPNVLAILASCITQRQNKSRSQVNLDIVSLNNINKHLKQLQLYFNCSQIIQLYYDSFLNNNQKQMSTQQMNYFKKALYSNPFLNKYKDIGKQSSRNLVINSQQAFLQVVDIYINIIKYQYKILSMNQISYRAVRKLSSYFYMVLLAAQNMSISVVDLKNNLSTQWNEEFSDLQNQQAKIKQIKLWKIIAQIVEGYVMNKIYIGQKDKIMYLMLSKIVAFIKNKVSLNKEQENGKKNEKNMFDMVQKQLKGYQNSFVKIITYMPLQIFRKVIDQEPDTIKYISGSIMRCVLNATKQSQDYKNLIKNVIKLAKYKKSFILNQEQWIQVFSSLKKNDTNFQLMNLYFFLASTGDKTLIQQIPLPQMIKFASKKRADLEEKKIYKSLGQQNVANYDYKQKGDIDENYKKWATQTNLNLTWQIFLLQIHALLLMTNPQKKKVQQLLNKHSLEYKIQLKQIQMLFNKWILPFRYQTVCNVKQDGQSSAYIKQISYKLVFNNILLITPHFQNYFKYIFAENECFYQPDLINKILMHPTTESYFLYTQQNPNINFISFLMTLINGLGDPKNKQKYLAKYPFDAIFPSNLRKTAVFKFQYLSNIMNIFDDQQWNYFLKLLLKTANLHLSTQTFREILNKQYIYKTSAVELIQKQQKNQKQLKGAAAKLKNWNFNKTYDIKNIKNSSKYTNEEFISINNIIIKSLLEDVVHPDVIQTSYNSRANFIVNYVYQFVFSQSNLAPNMSMISEENKKSLSELLNVNRTLDNKALAVSMYKLHVLGLFDKEQAQPFLNKKAVSNFFSFPYEFCIAILGKDQAVKRGLKTNESWEQLSTRAANEATKSLGSIIWLLIKVKTMNYSDVKRHKHLWKKIYNPQDENIIISLLKKLAQKQGVPFKIEDVKSESSQKMKDEEFQNIEDHYDQQPQNESKGLFKNIHKPTNLSSDNKIQQVKFEQKSYSQSQNIELDDQKKQIKKEKGKGLFKNIQKPTNLSSDNKIQQVKFEQKPNPQSQNIKQNINDKKYVKREKGKGVFKKNE